MTDRKRTPSGMGHAIDTLLNSGGVHVHARAGAYHPATETIAALIDGDVIGQPAADLFAHLGVCDECRAAYQSAAQIAKELRAEESK